MNFESCLKRNTDKSVTPYFLMIASKNPQDDKVVSSLRTSVVMEPEQGKFTPTHIPPPPIKQTNTNSRKILLKGLS